MIVFQQQQKFINIWFWGIALYSDKRTFWRKYYPIFYFSFFIFIWSLFILQACTTKNTEIFIDAISYLQHFTVVFITWFIHQFHKKSLFKSVTASFYSYHWPAIKKIQKQRINKINQSLKHFLCCSIAFYVSFVFLLTNCLIIRLFKSEKNAGNYLFFLPTYHLWEINSEFRYYATYLMQLAIGGTLPSVLILGVLFYIFLFASEVELQYSILFSALHTIKIKLHQKTKNTTKSSIITVRKHNTNDYEVLQLLVECIKHHVNIIRFIRFFVTSYSPILTTFLIHSSIIFVSGVYLLMDDTYPSHRMIQKLVEFISVFPIAVYLCIIGEILENKNNDLRNILYDIQWYKESTQFRKTILIMLLNTTKEKNLRITVKNKASFSLLANVLRTSYSYLSILLNLRNKN